MLLMNRKRRRRRASTDGEGEGGSHRVQLACFWCRSKRVRCSGTKPVCEVCRHSMSPRIARVRRIGARSEGVVGQMTDQQACKKSNVTCEWPSGRRKKRTRKEMEEARRIEAQLRPGLSPGRTVCHASSERPELG